MATARYYDASKNPEERAFDGVPLRDLTEEEFEALPPWLQASVDAAPFYRKTKPRPATEADTEAPAERAADEAQPATPEGDTTTTSPEGAATTRRRRE